MGYRFHSTCVDWSQSACDTPSGLSDMIHEHSIDITRRTLLQHVGAEQMNEIESRLGYASHPSQGLMMARDYHVSYHRSKLHGKRCYYFKWSAIEHIFTQQGA